MASRKQKAEGRGDALEASEGLASRACELSTEQKVRHIADMMAQGLWFGAVSRYELSKAWGVTDSAIKINAAEASRLLKADPEDLAELRKTVIARFADIALRARNTPSLVTGVPDYKSEIQATELFAKYSGFNPEEWANATNEEKRIIIAFENPNHEPSPKK